MSAREFTQWVAYVESFGPIDAQRRYDEPAARLAAVLAQVHGNRGVTAADFLPYARRGPETGGVLVVDPEIHQLLKATP